MKTFMFLLLLICFSITCSAQQKQSKKSEVTFKPPVLKKDISPKKDSVKQVKFKPPILKKKYPASSKKRSNGPVKFDPPVLKKDAAGKQ